MEVRAAAEEWLVSMEFSSVTLKDSGHIGGVHIPTTVHVSVAPLYGRGDALYGKGVIRTPLLCDRHAFCLARPCSNCRANSQATDWR